MEVLKELPFELLCKIISYLSFGELKIALTCIIQLGGQVTSIQNAIDCDLIKPLLSQYGDYLYFRRKIHKTGMFSEYGEHLPLDLSYREVVNDYTISNRYFRLSCVSLRSYDLEVGNINFKFDQRGIIKEIKSENLHLNYSGSNFFYNFKKLFVCPIKDNIVRKWHSTFKGPRRVEKLYTPIPFCMKIRTRKESGHECDLGYVEKEQRKQYALVNPITLNFLTELCDDHRELLEQTPDNPVFLKRGKCYEEIKQLVNQRSFLEYFLTLST